MPYTAQPMPGYKALVQLASGSTSGTDLVLTDAGDHQTFNVGLSDAHRYLDRAVAPAVQTSTDGGTTWSGTLSASTYTLRNLTAQVVLNTPLSGGTTYKVRLHTFNYYPYAPIVQAWDITFTPTTQMLDITYFQGPSGSGFSSFIPGIIKGVFACKAWQLTPGSMVYVSHLTARDLLILSFNEPNGANFCEAYCYVDASTMLSSLTTVAEEDLSFTCDGIVSLI